MTEPPILKIFVPEARTLPLGGSKTFQFRRGRQIVEGFVLSTGISLVAYANECPHWYVDLDLGLGRFWDETTGRILCRNHAALFHPETGLCERGPCVGLSLESFELTFDGDGAWVHVPDATPIADP